MSLGVPGKCHRCKWNKLIKYCPLCGHWLCKRCRWDLAGRTVEALKEIFVGSEPGCCGPTEES